LRVTVDHHDVRRGWLFRKTFYEVHLTVAFTYEEKQIIRQRRLGETVLLRRRPATAKVDDRDEKFLLRLGDLLDGRTDRFLCPTPSAAKIYEEEVFHMMAQVKLWVTDNAETGNRTVAEF
jgi:hypothetical protein